MDNRITTNFYEKYKGAFAKRFYTPFLRENIHKIINYKIKDGMSFFKVTDEEDNQWWWDVDDCVIITNETPIIEDDRVANVNHDGYFGYNPYNGEIINEHKFA